MCYTSFIKPKNVNEASEDKYLSAAMHEKLNQFVQNDVWTLVPKPKDMNIIGTKWIFKSKTDDKGNITRNKARLVV